MLRIERLESGEHIVHNGEIDLGDARFYRKKVLTRAIKMNEPFSVETMEGTMEGKPGDWLMIGIRGEMYPCDSKVFMRTYEPVKEG